MLTVTYRSEVPENYTGEVEIYPDGYKHQILRMQLKDGKKHAMHGPAVKIMEAQSEPRVEYWIEGMHFSMQEYETFIKGLNGVEPEVHAFPVPLEIPKQFTGIAQVGKTHKVAMIKGRLIAITCHA